MEEKKGEDFEETRLYPETWHGCSQMLLYSYMKALWKQKQNKKNIHSDWKSEETDLFQANYENYPGGISLFSRVFDK